MIVVAIIAVLVAISIPIFTSQLEKAREATDAANIRSQYAEVMSEAITSGGDVSGKSLYGAVQLKQKKDGWQNTSQGNNLEGIFSRKVGKGPKAGGTAWVEYKSSSEQVILHYGDASGSDGSSSGGSGSGGTDSGSTSGGGSSSGTGDNTGGSTSGGGTLVDGGDGQTGNDPYAINTKTKLPNIFSTSAIKWQKIKEDNKGKDYYTVPGQVYISDDESTIYVGTDDVNGSRKKILDYNLQNGTPDTFVGWHALAKIDPSRKIFSEDDFNSDRNDLKQGDLCKIGNDYYVFKDGGTNSYGPIKAANQWVKIKLNAQ